MQFPILILFLFGIYNLHLERNERQQWGSKDLKIERNRISIMLFPGLVGGGGNWPLAAKSSTISDFWQSKWELKPNNKDGDHRIWNISQGQTIPNQKYFEHPGYNLKIHGDKPGKTLSEIAPSNQNRSA